MENEQTTSEKLKSRLKNNILVKVASITIVALLLLIPIENIKSLINERKFNQAAAIVEVSEKWGGIQTFSGPVLTVPYRVYVKTDKGTLSYHTEYAHFLPELLDIDGQVKSMSRNRGIYEVPLYNSKLSISGQFNRPDFSLWNIDESSVQWEESFLSIGIPDLTGVENKSTLTWNQEIINLESGIPNKDVLTSGIYSPVAISEPSVYKFSFKINLNGSEQLNFTPLGKQTVIDIQSDWAHPSFNGRFLPDSHDISKDGFTAHWKILDVNRNYPQQWIGSEQSVTNSAFGVNLFLPVDEYQKNMRSAKYAMLVITLSFLIFFLFEVIDSRKLHPMQYILVGLSIVIFYSLLLSMTEHIGFNPAYFISSALVISLIIFYSAYIFKNLRATALLGGLLMVIYTFIFVVLQLEDFALLVGSLGIFAALACFMYLSRNIDWYNLGNKHEIETA